MCRACGKNTHFDAADAFVRKHGLELARVTPRFMVKGGPALALLNTNGHFGYRCHTEGSA